MEEQKSKEIEGKQGGLFFKLQISGILEDEKDSIDENKSILSRNLAKSMSSPKQKKEDLEEEKKKLEDAEIKKYGVPFIFCIKKYFICFSNRDFGCGIII